MTSPAEFLPEFVECSTHREADTKYRDILRDLQEALRQTHGRIVARRDAPVTTGITRTRRDNSDVHDNAVRSWARLTGYVMPVSGRVTNDVRDAYRARNLVDAGTDQEVVSEAPAASEAPMVVDQETVRQWAINKGIEFQRVSKNLRKMYDEAHQE